MKWQAPLTFRQWQLELREVRTPGFAVDRGRDRRGMTIFSVPVPGGDSMPTRFLNALVFSHDSNTKADAALVARLQQSAREIAAALEREP